MPKAVWNGAVLAESENTVVIEGNHYFPPEAVRWEHLEESPAQSRCVWKGVASYYGISVDGKTNRNAAWTYPNPTPAAEAIKGHVAFWRGVQIVRADGQPVAGPFRKLLARLGITA